MEENTRTQCKPHKAQLSPKPCKRDLLNIMGNIKIWFKNNNYVIIESIEEIKDYDNVVSFEYLGVLE